MKKQDYIESLYNRIAEMEILIGQNIDEPYTADNISHQLLNIRGAVKTALKNLSYEIRELIDTGSFL